jgi:hypothetical protein
MPLWAVPLIVLALMWGWSWLVGLCGAAARADESVGRGVAGSPNVRAAAELPLKASRPTQLLREGVTPIEKHFR